MKLHKLIGVIATMISYIVPYSLIIQYGHSGADFLGIALGSLILSLPTAFLFSYFLENDNLNRYLSLTVILFQVLVGLSFIFNYESDALLLIVSYSLSTLLLITRVLFYQKLKTIDVNFSLKS